MLKMDDKIRLTRTEVQHLEKLTGYSADDIKSIEDLQDFAEDVIREYYPKGDAGRQLLAEWDRTVFRMVCPSGKVSLDDKIQATMSTWLGLSPRGIRTTDDLAGYFANARRKHKNACNFEHSALCALSHYLIARL